MAIKTPICQHFGRNNLSRNDLLEDGSRRFVDVAAEAGVEDVASGCPSRGATTIATV